MGLDPRHRSIHRPPEGEQDQWGRNHIAFALTLLFRIGSAGVRVRITRSEVPWSRPPSGLGSFEANLRGPGHMPGRDIMVIGFSAGGVEALARLVAALPRDLPAALFVVHHFPAAGLR